MNTRLIAEGETGTWMHKMRGGSLTSSSLYNKERKREREREREREKERERERERERQSSSTLHHGWWPSTPTEFVGLVEA